LIKTLFPPFLLQENIYTPPLVGLELSLGDLDQKKDFGGNETKSKAGQCKEPIIYSISSPLGLCHVQAEKSLPLHNSSLRSLSSA